MRRIDLALFLAVGVLALASLFLTYQLHQDAVTLERNLQRLASQEKPVYSSSSTAGTIPTTGEYRGEVDTTIVPVLPTRLSDQAMDALWSARERGRVPHDSAWYDTCTMVHLARLPNGALYSGPMEWYNGIVRDLTNHDTPTRPAPIR